MPELDLLTWGFILVASVMAGFIDSAVGGGGMITVPMLFTALPQVMPATLLGTNKIAAVGGTAMAALQFTKKVAIQWRLVLPSMLSAGLASILGAYSISYVPVEVFKKFLPPLLVILLIYTVLSKQLGQTKVTTSQQSAAVGIIVGALCGFYDGVFGPGAGSFLTLLWVRGYGFDFLTAVAHAKWVNLATNVGSIAWFVTNVPMYFAMGFMMMACNTVGAFLGSKIVIKYGNEFVRKLFIVVVAALIARTTYDAYFR